LAETFRLWVGKHTDAGRLRDHNEDSYGIFVPTDPVQLKQLGSLFAVADGMGGHAAGEIASKAALDSLIEVYFATPEPSRSDALRKATHAANERVVAEAAKMPERRGMGTTLVAAVIHGDQMVVANVGDCRLYLLRRGVLSQMTKDHSFVAEQVRAGLITEEEARNHPRRNIISRALGTPEAEPDISEIPIQANDVIIMCSDGLHGVVNNEEIAKVGQNPDPTAAARNLVDLANTNGGPDNITVLVIRVEKIGIDPNAVTQVLPKITR